MKIQNITKVGAAIACALTMSANAANLVDVSQIAKGYSSDNINHVLGLVGDTQMKAAKTIDAGNGVTKVRFNQEYKGIPVFGHSVAATQTEMGVFTNVQGKMLDLSNAMINTKARISAKQAMQDALTNDKKLGNNKAAAKGVYNKENDMYIFMSQGRPHVAHRVSYVVPAVDGGSPSRPVFFIDAHTGETLYTYDNIQHADIGTGPGGNTKTGQYNYGTDFGYMDVTQSGSTCTMNNADVKTVNLNHGTSGSTAYSYTCPENTHKAINGAFSPLNDAQYFGNVVFDMFNAYVGTPPLSFQLTMRVHYSNSYQNAFWDGSAMTFGDGGSTFYPLVSLDVSAHEVAHGFTEQNSGLIYSNQSGGMNEAYSDMAGEAAEYFMNGTNDWMVGEQIFKSSGALRYMQNPPDDGSSIGHANDYYSGMDVHYSSGVYNKAFYLLATTAGWNTETAFKVMSLANQTYWTASSTYDEGACGVESAAGDLGYTVADVTAAFLAVGVGCGGTPPPPPPPTVELDTDVAVAISGATASETFFSYVTPADVATATFNMSGGSGDADLYVKFGSAPTSSSYDCRPYAGGNTEECDFSAAEEGTYYVMVRGYSSYSGASLVATHTSTGTPPPPPTGDTGSMSNISVGSKEWATIDHSSITIPAGVSTFTVTMSGGTGDADMYILSNGTPTSSNYDCRPFTYGNSETCTAANPDAGTMGLGIFGYSAASGFGYTWSYE
jgi:vibriolysin